MREKYIFFDNGYLDGFLVGEGHRDNNFVSFCKDVVEARNNEATNYQVSLTHFGNTSDYVRALNECKNFPGMQSLGVNCQNVPRLEEIENAVTTLIDVIESNQQLSSIDLTHLQLSDSQEVLRLFEAIQTHPKLANVRLTGAVFSNINAQASFFAAMAKKENLTTLNSNFDFQGFNGFDGLIRQSISLTSLYAVPITLSKQLLQGLIENDRSRITSVTFSSPPNIHHCTMPGNVAIDLVELLMTRSQGQVVEFSNPYFAGIKFSSEEDVRTLLKIAQVNFTCLMQIEIAKIGGQNRYISGNPNPFVDEYQRQFTAIYNRNVGIVSAFQEVNSHRESGDLDLTLPEFVYLYHMKKYKEAFKGSYRGHFPVSLRVKSYFVLFQEKRNDSIDLPASSVVRMHDRVVSNTERYKL